MKLPQGMGQALGLCCTLGETKALREEVAFFQAVKVILTTRDVTAQKKTDAQCEQPNRYKFNSLKRLSYKRWRPISLKNCSYRATAGPGVHDGDTAFKESLPMNLRMPECDGMPQPSGRHLELHQQTRAQRAHPRGKAAHRWTVQY